MGCRQSKIDSGLIKYCRERKEVIKASRDSLYSLANAHNECMQSLQSVEIELRNFLAEALVICFKSPLNTHLAHQTGEEVCQPKDSPLESDEDEDVQSLTEFVHGRLGNVSERSSKEVSDSVPAQPQVQPINITSSTEQPHHRYSDGSSKSFPGSFGFPRTTNVGFFASSDFDFQHRNHILVDDWMHSIPNISNFANHESWESSNQQRSLPRHYHTYNYVQSSPPYPDVTTWDFINPFNSTEKSFPDLYFQGRGDTNFGSNYVDLGEVRERKGKPELENELHDPIMDDSSGEEGSQLNEDSGNYLSENAVRNAEDVRPDEEVTTTRNQINDLIEKNDHESRPSSSQTESLKLEKVDNIVIPREHEEFNLNETTRVEAPETDVTEPDVTPTLETGSTDLHEVLGYINHVFETIIIHGKDVWEMLEPYQPHVALIKRPSSKGTSVLRRVMLKRRAYRKLKFDHHEACGTETSTTLFSLSWTLEKLYNWENKLYDEVKDEEKLREILDREWLKLKKLDHRGAESFKIDASQSSLKRLTPKMNVSLSRIEGIARETHKITNDELQPQLCEYIHRLRKLSKVSYESLQKQVQAISRSRANIDIITCTTSTSSQTATEKLETVIINLETTFSCWIRRHKTFVVLLKKWLGKFQEQKEVSDSIPSSPISLSTPDVFTICNEWLNAVEKVSDVEVSLAFKNFALILSQLRVNLREERCQKLKLEYLSNYHEKKLMRFCADNGFDWDQYASLFREADLTSAISGNSSLDALYTRLRPVRDKLREATVRHEEAVQHVNDVAAGIFQNGLIPVLEAFERCNLEMFQAYEQVRIPNEGSVL